MAVNSTLAKLSRSWRSAKWSGKIHHLGSRKFCETLNKSKVITEPTQSLIPKGLNFFIWPKQPISVTCISVSKPLISNIHQSTGACGTCSPETLSSNPICHDSGLLGEDSKKQQLTSKVCTTGKVYGNRLVELLPLTLIYHSANLE